MNAKKKFQELNLCDNFLFAATMQDPETCRAVLELLLKIEIEKVVVATEKTMVFNPERRGIRMDVYAADQAGSIYNVEMQVRREGNLAKRSRYYQGAIDVGQLKPGEDYNKLPKSFIIFICTFDPFEENRCLYSVEERCLETGSPLGDETRKIFLNTKGTDIATMEKELIYFLKYVEDSTEELVEETESIFLKRLHKRVMEIKHDRETEERYMLFEEMLARKEAEGIERGIEQGIKQGIDQGRKLGEKQTKDILLKLVTAMNADGNPVTIARLLEDQEFFDEMIDKYQIKNI